MTYIIIMAIYMILAVISIFYYDCLAYNASQPKLLAGILSLFGSIILFGASFCDGIGNTTYTTKAAYSQRVGNEIIVQVDGWPTTSTTNIKFDDVPLSMEQVQHRNAWGIVGKTEYFVDTLKP